MEPFESGAKRLPSVIAYVVCNILRGASVCMMAAQCWRKSSGCVLVSSIPKVAFDARPDHRKSVRVYAPHCVPSLVSLKLYVSRYRNRKGTLMTCLRII
jgi:hypothetical protein